MKVSILLRSVTACLLLSVMASAAGAGGHGEDKGRGTGRVISELTLGEREHLVFMREEEKLARDVYITLGAQYSRLRVFGNIDDSEQRHTSAVRDMLEKYGIKDPSANDNVGAFTGENYGPYFTKKFNELVERGRQSDIEALKVGALIEELDMLDIKYCPLEVLAQTDALEEMSDCGRVHTEKSDLYRLYSSLLEGSENHLRAYVKLIERRQGKGSYEAQILTQDQVDVILGR